MARSKKVEIDIEMYAGLSEDEIKEAIVRSLSRKAQAEIDLKAHQTSYKELIAEMDERISLAMEELRRLRGEVPLGEPSVRVDVQ